MSDYEDIIHNGVKVGEQLKRRGVRDEQKEQTYAEFIDAMTDAEAELYFTEMQTNIKARVLHERMKARGIIDPEEPKIAAGIEELKSRGVLSTERVDTVFKKQKAVVLDEPQLKAK
jgi:hypothetical protein